MTLSKIICKRCNKIIKDKDKSTTWITKDKGKIIEEINWHFKCFLEWRDESLMNRAKELYANTMKETLSIAKNIMQNTQ